MSQFSIPTREQVSESNQSIFDNLEKQVGFVPNLFAYFGKHDNALADYLALSGRKSTLNNKEKEVVSLVASQINECGYCQAAHTAIGKLNGFSEEEILSIRKGELAFDDKLEALAKLTTSLVENKGGASQNAVEDFFKVGYNEQNLIDTIFVIADKTITNFIARTIKPTIDFPEVPSL